MDHSVSSLPLCTVQDYICLQNHNCVLMVQKPCVLPSVLDNRTRKYMITENVKIKYANFYVTYRTNCDTLPHKFASKSSQLFSSNWTRSNVTKTQSLLGGTIIRIPTILHQYLFSCSSVCVDGLTDRRTDRTENNTPHR